MTRDAFAAHYTLDPATLDRFDRLAAMLTEASAAHNLVGRSTLADLWSRHFADSAQLAVLAPADARWLDVGTGAGFPGLVLALLGRDVTMVEATAKKVAFVRAAIAALGLTASVLHARIESLRTPRYDAITARALAPVATVFDWTQALAAKSARWVLPKGERVETELAAARVRYRFESTLVPSLTAPAARIVVATGVWRA